ncbi:hypothetical protein [uncultured Tateyamaria sp.]|uniref:hypothetical protein n=1 Tax=Tateyamaria sp. 1078 TaxID=3417464 RepID=UPI00262DA152|nr:hypothetical protein [uncultured Tateyamaria sp.]
MKKFLLMCALAVLAAPQMVSAQDNGFQLDLDAQTTGERVGRPLLITLAVGATVVVDTSAFCRMNGAVMVVAGTPTNPQRKLFPVDLLLTRVSETEVTADFAPDVRPDFKAPVAMALATSPDCTELSQRTAAPGLLLVLRSLAGATRLSALIDP